MNEPAAPLTPSELVKRIPMFRWRVLANRYEIPFDQIASDQIALMFITANEIHRQASNGRDALERFEAMTMEELTAYIADAVPDAPAPGSDAALDAEDAAEAADKSV